MNKLWALLGSCRRGDPAVRDKNLKAAWFLVLEPYEYQDVRSAVLTHFRSSKYFPDVGEITQHLPRVPPPPSKAQMDRADRNIEILRRIAAQRKDVDP